MISFGLLLKTIKYIIRLPSWAAAWWGRPAARRGPVSDLQAADERVLGQGRHDVLSEQGPPLGLPRLARACAQWKVGGN
jgi:hypothetical protein